MVTVVYTGPYPREDLSGRKFNRLTVLSFGGRTKAREALWNVECECGKIFLASQGPMKGGATKSCGCYRLDCFAANRTTHGGKVKYPSEYNIYKHMLYRCRNPKNISYKYYGARGITVCDRWARRGGFADFISDMGPRPTERHSIDRIDTNGNYEPGNCRWALSVVQNRNSRHNVIVNVDGADMPMSAACEKYGVAYNPVQRRVKILGWDIMRALKTPIRKITARANV